MSVRVLELKGCAPAPLAHYLKALGILRLVVEQGADDGARGWWQDEHFRLLTKLTREELEGFFLQRYAPTPLLSPWNKGCGFFKPDDPGLGPLEGSRASRLAEFRKGVAAARRLLDAQSHADAVVRAIKARTKTKSAFQSDQQRELVRSSETYLGCVEQLRQYGGRTELAIEKRAEIDAELATIEGIAAAPAPEEKEDKQGRKALKASSGYKRLLAMADRRYKELKETLIPDCRLSWRGTLAAWMTAAVVLDEEGKAVWPSLLGTGGNDGNLDFTNNFMQRIGELLEVSSEAGGPKRGVGELLAHSLWGEPATGLGITAVGQYQPGAAGGANSTTGTVGESLVNPWDFVLMMEGAVLFRSNVSKRLDPNALGRAAAPFAVRSHAAGYGSAGAEKAQRGEQWMPLWGRPATLSELASLFGESRVQLGRQVANRPVDVARAISRLGAARGVVSFCRYGYLERNGQSTLAVPLGRMDVREVPRGRLVDDLAPWMDRLQRLARGKLAPARLVQAERRLSDAVVAALVHDEACNYWQEILLAAVEIERLQAAGCGIEAGPIPALSPEWITAAGEGAATRLAASMGSAAASYTKEGGAIDPVRHHWLPLEKGGRRFRVKDKRLVKAARVVMMGRDALMDCAAVVERRLTESSMKGERTLPLVAAPGYGARLGDVAMLLSGGVDFGRVVELARALMAVRWGQRPLERAGREAKADGMPPEGWLAIRLACLPWALPPDRRIPAEAGMLRRLSAGDSAGAMGLALARLRSAGMRPPLQAGALDEFSARLWAASLVFPIDRGSALRAAAALDPNLKGSCDA